MSVDLQTELATLIQANPSLKSLSVEELTEAACSVDAGIWSEVKRGFRNADFQWEWYDLAQTARRLAVIAPREHAKSEIFSVNTTAHHAIYQPGFWTYIFCNSGDQGEKILGRIVEAIAQTAPDLLDRPKVMHTKEVVFGNGSRVTVRGSGAAVRGAHPDMIIGDDVQDENNTATQMQRDRLKQWWFGTVGGMAHPGTQRLAQVPGKGSVKRDFPATRIVLVGTPFHALDLLMGCRENEMYTWRLYGAVTPVERVAA